MNILSATVNEYKRIKKHAIYNSLTENSLFFFFFFDKIDESLYKALTKFRKEEFICIVEAVEKKLMIKR